MRIPTRYHDVIRSIKVDGHPAECDYEPWLCQFDDDQTILDRIHEISDFLGTLVRRSALVRFYRTDADLLTKFMAAMIWGHSAAPNERRDYRGPWKVKEMMYESNDLVADLEEVAIDDDESIRHSYELLASKRVKRLGPSFLTKHLYFLGKATRQHVYPLILDDRVASGLVRMLAPRSGLTGLVSVKAMTKADAYIRYLAFAREEKERIRCSLDKIEYFLFKNMNPR